MKKILSIVMAMALLLSCLVFTSSAAADVTATIATVSAAINPGDEVRIPITISDYANAYATIDVDNIEYDETLLSFKEIKSSNVDFSGAFTSYGEAFSLIAAPTSTAAAGKVDGGEVCVLVFTVLAEITEITEVSASVVAQGYVNGEADNWVEFAALNVNVVSGGLDPNVKSDATATVALVQGPFAEGDEIIIPVTITEWANAYATIDVTIPEYDETLLTFDGYEGSSTDFAGAMTSSGTKGFGLVAAPSNSREADKVMGGEVCIMYFYAATDINEDTVVSVKVTASGYTLGAEDSWVANTALNVSNVKGGITMDVLHTCTPSGDIQSDATDHWYNCECGKVVDKAAHSGGKATCTAKAECSVCGTEYGEINASNHAGATEIRDAVAGDCGNAGYTGDTYCLDCGEMTKKGTVVAATGNHNNSEATCIAKAKCSVCGLEQGEIDENNHKNTEVRNATVAYTGDTWCLDCGVMVQKGEDIIDTTPVDVTATIGTVTGNFATGDTIRIPVTMSQYDNAYGTIRIDNITFDTTLLKLVDIEASATDFDGAMTSYNDGIFAMIAVPANADAAAKIDGGELCVLVFEAVADINVAVEVSATVTGRVYTYGEVDQWVLHKDFDATVVSGGIAKPKVLYGDVDGNGVVNNLDAELVAQYYGKFDVELNLDLADVDGNGIINVRDSMLIQQYHAGIITSFPVED